MKNTALDLVICLFGQNVNQFKTQIISHRKNNVKISGKISEKYKRYF